MAITPELTAFHTATHYSLVSTINDLAANKIGKTVVAFALSFTVHGTLLTLFDTNLPIRGDNFLGYTQTVL